MGATMKSKCRVASSAVLAGGALLTWLRKRLGMTSLDRRHSDGGWLGGRAKVNLRGVDRAGAPGGR